MLRGPLPAPGREGRPAIEEIPRLEAETDHLAVELLSKEELSLHGLDFYSRWETLELPEKRAIVETMVERITVGKDEITIDLVGVPQPPGNRGTLATQLQGFIAKVPLTLTAPTPRVGYPKQVNNLGDEIRSRRLDLGLQQKEVARRLGICAETLSNWERSLTSPRGTIYGRLRKVLGL